MKNIFAIAFLLAMLVQTFRMGIIEVDFFINQNRIAEELCENKAKPELECAGHCQLKKELEKSDESPDNIRLVEVSPFLLVSAFQIETPQILITTSKLPVTVPNIPQGYGHDIFHPPALG